MKNAKKLVPLSLLFLLVVIILANVSIAQLNALPNEFYVDYQEIEKANKEKRFGGLVDLELKPRDLATSKGDFEEEELVFKLFGFIPIKKVIVKILPEQQVYVGGAPIGLDVKTNGAIIISDSVVDASSSKIIKNKWLHSGDLIVAVDDEKIGGVEDLTNVLSKSYEKNNVEVAVLRDGKEIKTTVPLLKNNDKVALGVWVRDDIGGIGTLSFVSQDNQFGALGHAIANGKDEQPVPIVDGNIYSCSLIGIDKGERNNPGQLQCVFVSKDKKGTISKNTQVGVFGFLEDLDDVVDTNKTISLGGRLSVENGAAKLVSSVSGINEEYDIEIIKTNYQKGSADKSFVFRVKDKRLLELTGGIVQGMSGSPIIQNGKLIGTVTHVFVSDATKGYGVYSDWMIENLK